jgi:hypothetical protein
MAQFGLWDVAWAIGSIALVVFLRMAGPRFYRRYIVKRSLQARAARQAERVRYVAQKEPVPQSSHAVPLVPGTGTRLNTAEIARGLTEDQFIEVLALARNARGRFLFSGRKIYSLVGGNYGEFLVRLRQLRGDEKDDMPEEPTILTPIAGRPTKASYYNDADLEYQSPPN